MQDDLTSFGKGFTVIEKVGTCWSCAVRCCGPATVMTAPQDMSILSQCCLEQVLPTRGVQAGQHAAY